MAKTFSVEQEEFLSWAAREDLEPGESAIVTSVAGSGKTTAIAEAACRMPFGGSRGFFTFGVNAREELERRLPEFSKVRTLHSLALSALSSMAPVTVDKDKGKRIAREIDKGGDFRRRRALEQMMSLAKCSMAEKFEDVKAVFRSSDLYVKGGPEEEDRFIHDVRRGLSESLKDVVTVDYADMIWFAARNKNAVPTQYDWVIVDEAQDTDLAQMTVLSRAVKPEGHFLCVGDKCQSVYHFRGASANAMDLLAASASRGPLRSFRFPLSYRSSQRVAAFVRETTEVRDFRALENAPEGSVTRVPEGTRSWRRGDFVLSRTNAPLVEECLRCLKEGTPSVLVGRGLAELLRSMVESFSGETTREVMRAAYSWKSEEIAVLEEEGEKTDSVLDRFACLEALARGTSRKTEILERIETLFRETAGPGDISFSTIHRSKGLEAEKVFVLLYTFNRGLDSETDANLYYVAITRAKRDLVLVGEVGSQDETFRK